MLSCLGISLVFFPASVALFLRPLFFSSSCVVRAFFSVMATTIDNTIAVVPSSASTTVAVSLALGGTSTTVTGSSTAGGSIVNTLPLYTWLKIGQNKVELLVLVTSNKGN